MSNKSCSTVYTESGIPIKLRRSLGLGYIIAACFFLFNPNFTVIDFLPDVIGYVFICMGLSQISFINPSLEEAADKFKRMIFIAIGKLAGFLILFGLFDNRERPYGFLLFTFTFLVLELVFLIPAIKSLFGGLTYLSGRYKSEIAYKTKGRKSYIEKIQRSTIIFCIVKVLGYTLPEFTVLTKDEYTDNSFIMYMYDNIGGYRVLAFLIVMIVGIVWLCKAARFFSRLSREEAFSEGLRNDFMTKALPREGMFIKRAVKNALIVLGAAAVFGIDFHVSVTLDGVSSSSIALNEITLNIIPDVISAFLFLAAAMMLKNYIVSYKKLVLASSVYMAASAVASVLKMYFLYSYSSFTAVNRLREAAVLFYSMCASTIIENIAFLLTVISFALFMKELIKKYTGYIPAKPDHTTEGLLNSTHKELISKVWVAVGVAVIGAIFASVYDFMLAERHYFSQISWVLDFVIQGAFAVAVMRALFAVSDEVNSRYMLS